MHVKLGDILVRSGVIDEAQLLAALGEQKSWGHRLGVTLVKMGFLSEPDLVNALANQLNLSIAKLEGKRILPEVLGLVPEEFANRHMCLPLFVKQVGNVETLFLGMDDPCNLQVLDDVGFRSGMRIQPVLVASSELCQGIDYFYRDGSEGAPPPPPSTQPLAGSTDDELAAPLPGEEDYAPVDAGREREAPSEVESEPIGGVIHCDQETRKILRVLTQMLIEKGVIEREEIGRRVAAALEED